LLYRKFLLPVIPVRVIQEEKGSILSNAFVGFTPGTLTDRQLACENLTWIDGLDYTANNDTATLTIIGCSANGFDAIVKSDLTIAEVNNTGSDNSITVSLNQPVDLCTLLSSGA
jgi:hypothetical protein